MSPSFVHKYGLRSDSLQGPQLVTSRAGLEYGPHAPNPFLFFESNDVTHRLITEWGCLTWSSCLVRLTHFRKKDGWVWRSSIACDSPHSQSRVREWLAYSRAWCETVTNKVANVCQMSQTALCFLVTATHYWGRVLIGECLRCEQGLGWLMVQGIPYRIPCPPQCQD